MTFTTETVTDTPVEPQWVITYPGHLSTAQVDMIREQWDQAGRPPGKPIVLPEGAVLYDARNSSVPMPMVTSEVLEVSQPRLPLLLSFLQSVSICALALAVILLAQRP